MMQRRFTVTITARGTVKVDKGRTRPVKIGKGKIRELMQARLGKLPFEDVKIAYAPDPVKAKKAKPKTSAKVKRRAVPKKAKPVRKTPAKARKTAAKPPVPKKSPAKAKPKTAKKKPAPKRKAAPKFYVYNRRGERRVA